MLRARLQDLAGIDWHVFVSAAQIGFRSLAATLCAVFRGTHQLRATLRKSQNAGPPSAFIRRTFLHSLNQAPSLEFGCNPWPFLGLAAFGLRTSLFDLF